MEYNPVFDLVFSGPGPDDRISHCCPLPKLRIHAIHFLLLQTGGDMTMVDNQDEDC